MCTYSPCFDKEASEHSPRQPSGSSEKSCQIPPRMKIRIPTLFRRQQVGCLTAKNNLPSSPCCMQNDIKVGENESNTLPMGIIKESLGPDIGYSIST
jgi:hypothetical protein